MIDEKELRHKIGTFRHLFITSMDCMLNEPAIRAMKFTLYHFEKMIDDLEEQERVNVTHEQTID